MSYFNELIEKLLSIYPNFASQALQAEAAIKAADEGDEDNAYQVRVNELSSLVDVANAENVLPGYITSIERPYPNSVRLVISDEHGMKWRWYVFQEDVLFCYVQAIDSSLHYADHKGGGS